MLSVLLRTLETTVWEVCTVGLLHTSCTWHVANSIPNSHSNINIPSLFSEIYLHFSVKFKLTSQQSAKLVPFCRTYQYLICMVLIVYLFYSWSWTYMPFTIYATGHKALHNFKWFVLRLRINSITAYGQMPDLYILFQIYKYVQLNLWERDY